MTVLLRDPSGCIKRLRARGWWGSRVLVIIPFMHPDKSLSFAIAIRRRNPRKSLRVQHSFVPYIFDTLNYASATEFTQDHEAFSEALRC
jgi:hypothetical protein